MTAATTSRNAPSTRTLDQRREALQVANNIRFRRAAMKTDLRAGADPVPLLTDPPAWLLSMKAEKFLACLPRVGVVKAAAILRTNHISLSKTIGGLSSRQREALVAVVRNLRGRDGHEDAPGASAPTGPSAPASGALNA